MDSFRHSNPAPTLFQGILSLLLFADVFGTHLRAEVSTDPFAAWDTTLTRPATAPFPPIAGFQATYRFGWEGVGAGGADVRIKESSDSAKRRITASGGPNEWVHKLWNYQANYEGEAGVNGEVPSWFHMDEKVAKGKLVSDASFTPDALVACHRFTTETKPWSSSNLPGIRDLFAAMLFVRSQPLHDGDHLRMTIFPDRNPYLVDLTVEGRDSVMVGKKKMPAIRFTVRIQTIELEGDHKGRLAPHKKFHSGRVWMSDDARRLPLRAEVDVFIGAVFAELVKITPPL